MVRERIAVFETSVAKVDCIARGHHLCSRQRESVHGPVLISRDWRRESDAFPSRPSPLSFDRLVVERSV